MGIFGRRKVKKVKGNDRKFMPPIEVERINNPPQQHPQPQQTQPFQQRQEQHRPVFPPVSQPGPMAHDLPTSSLKYVGKNASSAPLFIKLSKYNDILYSLEQLKTSVSLMREQIAMLNEIDRLKSENMRLLETTTEKVSAKLMSIDSEFTRPQDFQGEYSQVEMDEVETLENTISDLQSQIEILKQEVGSLA